MIREEWLTRAARPGTTSLFCARVASTLLRLGLAGFDIRSEKSSQPPAQARARERSGQQATPWGAPTCALPGWRSRSGLLCPACRGNHGFRSHTRRVRMQGGVQHIRAPTHSGSRTPRMKERRDNGRQVAGRIETNEHRIQDCLFGGAGRAPPQAMGGQHDMDSRWLLSHGI